MKYIRTNDSVLELTREPDPKLIAVCTNKGWVYKRDIIKQAYTIKELCDAFVLNNEVITGSPRDGMSHLQLAYYYAKNGQNVFGAIWIKGKHDEPILKSVAKMNKKGELKLL